MTKIFKDEEAFETFLNEVKVAKNPFEEFKGHPPKSYPCIGMITYSSGRMTDDVLIVNASYIYEGDIQEFQKILQFK